MTINRRSILLRNARLIVTDGVKAAFSVVKRGSVPALKLDYQFSGAGYATLRLPVSIDLPGNFAFRFKTWGASPRNTLEFKVLDASTDNVWWVHRANFAFSQNPVALLNKRRHFWYAWGPQRELFEHAAFVDLTVTATSGGKGTVYFSQLIFEELPAPAAETEPVVTASSGKRSAKNVLDNDASTQWCSTTTGRQTVKLDLGSPREFGGLIVDFGEQYATDYEVQIQACNAEGRCSDRWTTVDRGAASAPGKAYHFLPECEARAIRLVFKASSAPSGHYSVRQIALQPLSFGSSQSRFLAQVARDLPAGLNPRYFLDEQSLWTVIGVSGSRQEGLINEQGLVELGRGLPSIDPFVVVKSGAEQKLLTWRDGEHKHALAAGYLPVPQVERWHQSEQVALTVAACAHVTGPDQYADSALYARYTVKNHGSERRQGSLYLALRPLQVNPPWQFLNIPGGFTPVHELSIASGRDHLAGTVVAPQGAGAAQSSSDRLVLAGDELTSPGMRGGRFAITLSRPADRAGVTTFGGGDVVRHLRHGTVPQAQSISDERGMASALMVYDFDLEPGSQCEVALALPYSDSAEAGLVSAQAAFAAAQRHWSSKLNRVKIVAPAAQALINTLKSQLAYILINRDGVAVQPGSRCYRRTWIRDGSLTCTALLQFGFSAEVRQFIEWFAAYLYPSGKVPCCVDKRGSDPTPEHDSHGQFIYLCMEYYRHTGDTAFVAKYFEHMVKAVDYIDYLRRQRLTAPYSDKESGVHHLFGILPESISHEGYSAKPAHSYWDDIFALQGLSDALTACRLLLADATCLSATALASLQIGRLTSIYEEFKGAYLGSIERSMQHHGIDFIPGAADLGDSDATSVTVALDPGDVLLEALPAQVERTFEHYWQYFCKRRDGLVDWSAYTPYEHRVVGTFVRLGQIDRAHALLDYFMQDRRPRGFNHWAEVVYRDKLHPGFVGDAPHGWVGSDFVRSVRSLFAYEHKGMLTLFAGVKDEWLAQGVMVDQLATHYGRISVNAQTSNAGVTYEITGDVSAPVRLRLPAGVRDATVSGVTVQPDRLGYVTINQPAATVVALY